MRYRRTLRYEPLEDRRLLATVTVTTLADTIDLADGLTSLREAIFATNLVAGPDTIQFAESLTASGPATILLRLGELSITDSLTIAGPTARALSIDATASDPTPDQNNGDGSRIFNIDNGHDVTLIDVTIDHLVLKGGDAPRQGGAILNRENLSISFIQVDENAAISNDIAVLSTGGGIAHRLGELVVTQCIIVGNMSDFGGGIHVENGTVTVERSMIVSNTGVSGSGIYIASGDALIATSWIYRNTAGAFSLGGGIYNSGNLRVDSTTISGNTASFGAGIFSRTDVGESTRISNSTVSDNFAFDRGGGVRNAAGLTSIEHSTITGNQAPTGDGAGVASRGYPNTKTEIRSTIISGNTHSDVDFVTGELNTFVSLGSNLIGSGNALPEFDAGGDRTGVLDPRLRPVADENGPKLPDGTILPMFAPLPDSPAINAGDLNAKAGVGGVPHYDQRGEGFPRIVNGRIDIGAYEFEEPSDLNLIVDTHTDESDGNFAIGDLSLREAIELANMWPSTDTIRFAPALTVGGPATILLKMGELKITDDASIEGPGAKLLTIDASASDPTPVIDDGKGSRVLVFDDGNRYAPSTMRVEGMTITGADVFSSFVGGGAIAAHENLTIADTILTGNAAKYAGAIDSRYGSLTILDSIIRGNHADRGGGIYALGTGMSLSNVTIADNVADQAGGGIVARIKGVVTIAHCTITGNKSQFGGGGISSVYGDTTISNSLISGNSLTSARGPTYGTGGGIASSLGTLTIQDSWVTDNSAALGGGIYTRNDSFLLIRSTVESNVARVNGGGVAAASRAIIVDSLITGNVAEGSPGFAGGGGGVFHSHPYADKGLTIQTSTVANNRAGRGGGIFVEQRAVAEIVQSTISGNFAIHHAGGMELYQGNIRHSTIVNNRTTGTTSYGNAAGVAATGKLTVHHSIIAGNRLGNGLALDVVTVQRAEFSLIGSNRNSGLQEAPVGSPDANGNLIGGPVHGEIDPRLGTLADNGGPNLPGGNALLTHALLPGSPAINTGDLNAKAGVAGVPLFDERGPDFPRIVNGRVDIGAYEFEEPSDLNLIVDTLVDELDNNFAIGDLSLREAINLANQWPSADTIHFAPDLTASGSATILLKTGELKVHDDLSLVGPGAELLTIDASGNDPTPVLNKLDGSRVLLITDGKSSLPFSASIHGLSLTGADFQGGNYSGGAIFSTENLTITSSTIHGNSALFGGAIDHQAGKLSIVDSTIKDNAAGFDGGGIWTSSDTVVINSTISGNTAGRSGGAFLAITRPLSVFDSTIINNAAQSYGGGIGVRSAGSISLTRSTIRGNSSVSGGGGGIRARDATVTVTDSTIASNSANLGGGIASYAGTLTLTESTISNNEATGADSKVANSGMGGGIFGQPAFTMISSSSIIGNKAAIDGGGIGGTTGRSTWMVTLSTISGNEAGRDGGGVSGRATLSNSTVSGNTAGRNGGAVASSSPGTSLTNSTISGNMAGERGGGIWLNGPATFAHTTIAENEAAIAGGGVFINAGKLTFRHAIVAKNAAPVGRDLTGAPQAAVAPQFSLIGSSADNGLAPAPPSAPDVSGNIIGGSEVGMIDPQLGALADNGGFTMTHALLPGSPAINAGDLSAKAGVGGVPIYDQRGEPLARIVNGRIDIGAYEFQEPSDLNLVVDTLADESDGDFTIGDLSLREAIELSNQWPSTDTIRFDSDLTAVGPATILLQQGELTITDDVSIEGPGAELLTIDASGNDLTPDLNDGKGSRIFNVNDGTGGRILVTVSSLRLTGGDVAANGGAVASTEALVLQQLVVENNAAVASSPSGGGIHSTGHVQIVNSRIVNNLASGRSTSGGAIAAMGGLVLLDSVVTGNIAGRSAVYSRSSTMGGAVGNTLIQNTTISANQGLGLEVFNADRATHIIGSTISDNTSSGGVRISTSSGGAVVFRETTVSGHDSGTGLHVTGTGVIAVEVVKSLIADNTSLTTGGGAVFSLGTAGALTMEETAFIDNRAPSGGGAFVSGNAQIVDCEFRGNVATSAVGNGGALVLSNGNYTISNCDIRNNVAGRDGGGIYASIDTARNVSLFRNNIVLNEAGDLGGGVVISASNGTASVEQSTIAQNSTAGSGGGLWVRADGQARVTVQGSTIHSNSAHVAGGGVFLVTLGLAEAVIQQSTISLNESNGSGGGIAIQALSGTAAIAHSTITENTADANTNGFGLDAGGGFFATGSGNVRLTHTILASNIGLVSGVHDFHNALSSNFQISHSLIGNNTGSGLAAAPVGMPDANGNLIGGMGVNVISVRLGPLAYHGGVVMTHAPAPNSPAINTGNPIAIAGVNNVPLYDQRGEPFTRVFGGRIDIGAVEAQPNPLAGDFNFDGAVDAADYALWRDTRGSMTDFRADGDGNGVINDADRLVWRANFGRTPENAGQGATSVEFEPSAIAPKSPALPTGELGAASKPWADYSFTTVRRRAVGTRLVEASSLNSAAQCEDSDLAAKVLQRTSHDERSDASPRRDSSRGLEIDVSDARASVLDCVFDALGDW